MYQRSSLTCKYWEGRWGRVERDKQKKRQTKWDHWDCKDRKSLQDYWKGMNTVEIDGVGNNEEFILHYLMFCPGRLSLLWLLAPGLCPKSRRKNFIFIVIVKVGPSNKSQIQSHWRKLWKTPDENILDFDDITDEEQCSQI